MMNENTTGFFKTVSRLVGASLCTSALLVPALAFAQLDGHGPDAWRVTGVEPGKVLDLRMGPGEQYLVIGSFQHDARGLQQITCVPYMTYQIFQELTPRQRDLLGPRWCMMHDANRTVAGWVPQANLMEDVVLADGEKVPGPSGEKATRTDKN